MKTRSEINWQPEDNRRLIAMIEAGGTAARAAVIFKRSITGVQHQATKLGKPFSTIKDVKRLRNAKIEAAERCVNSS